MVEIESFLKGDGEVGFILVFAKQVIIFYTT
jgi:hypothetical protein